MSVSTRMSQVLSQAKRLPYDASSRIVLMSDCHRGDGTWSDNFLRNQNLFFAALTYYYESGFTYIELGDGDELWENRKMAPIITSHSDAFWMLSRFYREGRFYTLFGNHDMVKRDMNYTRCNCGSFYNESSRCRHPLFPELSVPEGILLTSRDNAPSILLAHGHQGDLINDTFWKVSRFLVRYLWKPLELIGFNDPTSAARNYRKKEKTERRLASWCDEHRQILAAGHTHRPSFPRPGEAPYFNDGSCVHPRCITALEIVNNQICLVKWTVMTRENRDLYVGRMVLEEPVSLFEYAGINTTDGLKSP